MEYDSGNHGTLFNHCIGFFGSFVKVDVLHSASAVLYMNVRVLVHELCWVEAHGRIIPCWSFCSLGARALEGEHLWAKVKFERQQRKSTHCVTQQHCCQEWLWHSAGLSETQIGCQRGHCLKRGSGTINSGFLAKKEQEGNWGQNSCHSYRWIYQCRFPAWMDNWQLERERERDCIGMS